MAGHRIVRPRRSLPWAVAALTLAAGVPLTAQTETFPDVRINVPGDEALPNCNVQSTVTLARSGQNVVAGWVDAGECDRAMRRRVETANNSYPERGTTTFSLSAYGWSGDGGVTWHDRGVLPPPPGGITFGDSALAAGPDGVFYYATLARDAAARSIIGVARSHDGGRNFLPAVDASPGRSTKAFQDKPWLAVDGSATSPLRGALYAVWTEEHWSADPPLKILLSRSLDGGRSFEQPTWVDEGNPTAHYGAQVAVGPFGEVYVVWYGGERLLWFTRSLDGGATFSPPVIPFKARDIGTPRSCLGESRRVLDGDIRVRNWPALAVDTSGSSTPSAPDHNAYRGRVYVAVPHNRLESPPPAPNSFLERWDDQSDVGFSYSDDGGATWQRLEYDPVARDRFPARVNDDATTTDQFHPQVAVGPDGAVAVSWYDRRNSVDPVRPNWEIDVYAAISTDGGNTFGPNIRVTDRSFPPAQTHPNSSFMSQCYMGDYNSMVAGGEGQFLLAWGDNRDESVPGHPDPNVFFDRLSVVSSPPRP